MLLIDMFCPILYYLILCSLILFYFLKEQRLIICLYSVFFNEFLKIKNVIMTLFKIEICCSIRHINSLSDKDRFVDTGIEFTHLCNNLC
jgi:hypothetical protein